MENFSNSSTYAIYLFVWHSMKIDWADRESRGWKLLKNIKGLTLSGWKIEWNHPRNITQLAYFKSISPYIAPPFLPIQLLAFCTSHLRIHLLLLLCSHCLRSDQPWPGKHIFIQSFSKHTHIRRWWCKFKTIVVSYQTYKWNDGNIRVCTYI